MDKFGQVWISSDSFRFVCKCSAGFRQVQICFGLYVCFVCLFVCLLDLWFGSIFSKLAKFFMNWAKKLRLRHRCKVPKLLGILHCYRA